MNLYLLIIFATVSIYMVISHYYLLHKGKDFFIIKMRELGKEEKIAALPLMFKAWLFISLGMILFLLFKFSHQISPHPKSDLIFFSLLLELVLAALSLSIGLFFFHKSIQLGNKKKG